MIEAIFFTAYCVFAIVVIGAGVVTVIDIRDSLIRLYKA
jgi:hypothetical protein